MSPKVIQGPSGLPVLAHLQRARARERDGLSSAIGRALSATRCRAVCVRLLPKEHYSRALRSSGTWLARFWTCLRLISPSFPFERGMSILYPSHHCILEQNNLFHKFTAGDKFGLRMNGISPISDLDV